MVGTATADQRLNPDSNLARGCGGIGIIWNKRLKATPVAGIESDRICAVTMTPQLPPSLLLECTSTPRITPQTTSVFYTHYGRLNQHTCWSCSSCWRLHCHVGPEGSLKTSGSHNLHSKLLLEMVHNNVLFINSQSSYPLDLDTLTSGRMSIPLPTTVEPL